MGIHVARVGLRRGAWRSRVSAESLRERDHLEDLGVDGRITLKYYDRGAWTRSGWG